MTVVLVVDTNLKGRMLKPHVTLQCSSIYFFKQKIREIQNVLPVFKISDFVITIICIPVKHDAVIYSFFKSF